MGAAKRAFVATLDRGEQFVVEAIQCLDGVVGDLELTLTENAQDHDDSSGCAAGSAAAGAAAAGAAGVAVVAAPSIAGVAGAPASCPFMAASCDSTSLVLDMRSSSSWMSSVL